MSGSVVLDFRHKSGNALDFWDMGSPKNTLNTTLKKMGRLDKMIVVNLLIIVTVLIFDFLVTMLRKLRRPIFLEDIFGPTK
jgi:hypothetical protein